MDPVSGFATIVGLLSSFRSERSSVSSDKFNEFLEWLVEHNHEELKMLLTNNHQTSVGIKAILNQTNKEFSEKLSAIENAMSLIASSLSGFSGLLETLGYDEELSEQAKLILKQVVSSGASGFFTSNNFDGLEFYLNGTGEIKITDAQFINDDLATLTSLKLLRHGYDKEGNDTYSITRPAAKLVSQWENGV